MVLTRSQSKTTTDDAPPPSASIKAPARRARVKKPPEEPQEPIKPARSIKSAKVPKADTKKKVLAEEKAPVEKKAPEPVKKTVQQKKASTSTRSAATKAATANTKASAAKATSKPAPKASQERKPSLRSSTRTRATAVATGRVEKKEKAPVLQKRSTRARKTVTSIVASPQPSAPQQEEQATDAIFEEATVVQTHADVENVPPPPSKESRAPSPVKLNTPAPAASISKPQSGLRSHLASISRMPALAQSLSAFKTSSISPFKSLGSPIKPSLPPKALATTPSRPRSPARPTNGDRPQLSKVPSIDGLGSPKRPLPSEERGLSLSAMPRRHYFASPVKDMPQPVPPHTTAGRFPPFPASVMRMPPPKAPVFLPNARTLKRPSSTPQLSPRPPKRTTPQLLSSPSRKSEPGSAVTSPLSNGTASGFNSPPTIHPKTPSRLSPTKPALRTSSPTKLPRTISPKKSVTFTPSVLTPVVTPAVEFRAADGEVFTVGSEVVVSHKSTTRLETTLRETTGVSTPRCNTPNQGYIEERTPLQELPLEHSSSKTENQPESFQQDILAGLTFFLDVYSSTGENSNHLFEPLLLSLGASEVLSHWTSNSQPITHVLFKDGELRTLEKVVASNGDVKCVNVGWAVDCEKYGVRLPEGPYEIDLARVPGLCTPSKPFYARFANQTPAPATPGARNPISQPTPRRVPTVPLSPSPVKSLGMEPSTGPDGALLIKTPALRAATEGPDKENYSPTDSVGSPLLQRTCPPKQLNRSLLAVSPVGGLEGFRRRLMEGRRRRSDWVGQRGD